MASLFDLSAELMRIQALLDDAPDGEIPPEVLQWLEQTEGDFAAKIEGWASVIGQIEARAKARKEESERLRQLSDMDSRRADSMRLRLKDIMSTTGQTRVETTRYKVWLQAAGGKQPLQVIEAETPEEYKTTRLVEELNKDLIREKLEQGEELPFARLLPRGQVLRIK